MSIRQSLLNVCLHRRLHWFTIHSLSDAQAINTYFEKAHHKGETSLTTPSEPDAVGCDPGEKSCLYFTL